MINWILKAFCNPIKCIRILNNKYLWLISRFRVKYKKLLFQDAIIGKSCQIDRTKEFNVKERGKGIQLGKQTVIGVRPYNYIVGRWCNCRISQRQPGAVIKIGDRTRLNGVCICAQKEVIIGEDCQIACGVSLLVK